MAVSKERKISKFEWKSTCYDATIVFHCLCICYSFATYCLLQVGSKCLQILKSPSKIMKFHTKSSKCQICLDFNMVGNLEFILHKKFSNSRFNLDFMIIASLEIIFWEFQIVLKFVILNAKALATMLPLFSIVCAFATRLPPIVCSKRVASACRF